MGNSVYIVRAVRTPIGKFGGGLMDFTAPDLGVIAVRAAWLARLARRYLRNGFQANRAAANQAAAAVACG